MKFSLILNNFSNRKTLIIRDLSHKFNIMFLAVGIECRPSDD